MKITQVRNATLLIEFAGQRFLVDPMFADKESTPPFPGTPNGEKRNPLVDLPFPKSALVDVDCVILTHLHRDHWDDAAAEAIPKDIPMFVQDQADAQKVRAQGFRRVEVLGTQQEFNGVSLSKTAGQHGSDEAIAKIGDRLGQVCGVVFSAPHEQRLYIVGDTLWNDDVRASLEKHKPGVIVVNCGNAVIFGVGAIIMGAEDVRSVAQAAPDATIIASHLEAVNHCLLSRRELSARLSDWGLTARVLIPADGQCTSL